ncbi:MAG: hypothetical protein HDS14_08440 [Bacteroides sp.]|nr:hypothetical protein [Bacteroides sp.]
MKESVKERLSRFIKLKGLNKKKFEEITGLSNGYIGSIRKSIGSDSLIKMMNAFPDLNRDWLLYGEGEMLNVCSMAENKANKDRRIKRAISWLISQGIVKTQTEVGDKLGYTNKSSLSQIVNADKPSQEFINKFTKIAPMINKAWLLTGEGEMLTDGALSTPEIDDLERNKEMDKERLIPFYDVETTGGYNGTVSASDEGDLVGYIQPGGWFDARETAAIRHVGDSMVEYPSGCILAVRRVLERHLLVPGRNYVIETSEYRITKRLQKINRNDQTLLLYSTNTDKYEDGSLIHAPFEVALSDIINIYTVLGYIVNQSGEMRLIKSR